MIRLQAVCKRNDLEYLCKSILKVEVDPGYNMWQKFGWKDYKYNFKYEDKLQSFWFAYDFALSDKATDESRTFVVEYNPNKNNLDGMLLKLLRFINTFKCSSWLVKGGDIAIDLRGISRDSVFYDKKYYKHTVEFIENGSRTSYIGHRGWGGTKIYDKAKEQGLEGNWVRVEFTVKMGFELEYFRAYSGSSIEMTIPDINIVDYLAIDDIKLKAYYHLIACGLAEVSDFKRDIRKRLKETAISSSRLVIDNSIKNDLAKCMISYLEGFVNVLGVEAYPF